MRSQYIYGRIVRALKNGGFPFDDIVEAEIYDLMNEAQKQIFARINFDRKYQITLQKNQTEYPLQAGWRSDVLINVENNALQPAAANETNTADGFTATSGTIESIEDHRAGSEGIYAIKYTLDDSINEPVELDQVSVTPIKDYFIRIYGKAENECSIVFYLVDDDGNQVSNELTFTLGTTWEKFEGYLKPTLTGTKLQFYTNQEVSDAIFLDDLEIIESPENYSQRNIFAGIKGFLAPSTWDYEFQLASVATWNDIVNGGYYSEASNPVRGIIFDNKLNIHPAPSESGDELTIFAKLKGAETDIASDNDPELDPEWDLAIEEFALWRLMRDKDSLASFEKSIYDFRGASMRSGNTIQRPRFW